MVNKEKCTFPIEQFRKAVGIMLLPAHLFIRGLLKLVYYKNNENKSNSKRNASYR